MSINQLLTEHFTDFKPSKKNIFLIVWGGVILLTSLVLMAKVKSIQVLFPLVLFASFFILKDKFESIKFTYLDAGFLVLLIGEVLTTIFSSYLYNSLSSLTRLIVLLVLYIIYKTLIEKYRGKQLVSFVFFFFSTSLLIATVASFYAHYTNIVSGGFTDLNDYKNLYRPLKVLNNGTLNNAWSSALLIFIPCNLIFLINQKKSISKAIVLLSLLINTFALIVSFSRGIYLSAFVFVLVLNVLLASQIKLKKLLVYNLIVFLFISSSAFLVKDSFLTTIAINKTSSQKRSTQGRIVHWKQAIKFVKDKPVFGYGQKNYRLARTNQKPVKEGVNLSSRTNNTYLQLLIERGIFGFCCYLLFFLLICVIVYKNLRAKEKSRKERIEVIIIFSGIIAYLIRELTFATFFDTDLIYFLAFYLIMGFVSHDILYTEIQITKGRRIALSGVSFLIVGSIVYMNARIAYLIYYNNRFVDSYYSNNVETSNELIDKALTISIGDIDLNEHKALALTKNNLNIEISSVHDELLYFNNPNEVYLSSAIRSLKKVLEKNRFDANTLNCVGWLYFALDDKENAKIYFDESIRINPNESRYHISLTLLNIKNLDNIEATKSLSHALKHSPSLLESEFYIELAKKYPLLAIEAKQTAISDLKGNLRKNNDVIIKAYLARLLMNEDPEGAKILLNEVTNKLPNLNRPWTFLGYVNYMSGDYIKAEMYFEKSLQVRGSDFLPRLYFANYCKSIGKDNEAVDLYKKALRSYPLEKTSSFTKNAAIPYLTNIPTKYILIDLLYYTQPNIRASEIFQYFALHYSRQKNLTLQEYYNELSLKYKNELFVGGEKLP